MQLKNLLLPLLACAMLMLFYALSVVVGFNATGFALIAVLIIGLAVFESLNARRHRQDTSAIAVVATGEH